MDDKQKNDPIIRKVKKLRVEISAVIKEVDGNYSNREMAIVKTKLQEAKHWCGEYLGVLGQELPEEFRDNG